jgi:cell division protein FtsX
MRSRGVAIALLGVALMGLMTYAVWYTVKFTGEPLRLHLGWNLLRLIVFPGLPLLLIVLGARIALRPRPPGD